MHLATLILPHRYPFSNSNNGRKLGGSTGNVVKIIQLGLIFVAKKLSKIRILRIKPLSGVIIVFKLVIESLSTKFLAFLISYFRLILSRAAFIISEPRLFC